MARRIDAYVDTSALIAFLDRSDSYHQAFRRLFAQPPSLITSALVVAEGHGWFLRRYDQRRAVEFLSFLQELAVLHVAPFGPDDLPETIGIVQRFSDQRLTLADAHGLVLMRRARVKACWSTDRHLGLTGVPLVIA
ncbi:MAG: PIN domain-containing protein [Bryobacteraceae bacterium]|jgi:predicted nucleic acid-binding protein